MNVIKNYMSEDLLKEFVCKNPFSYLDVNHNGSYMCCPSWLGEDITQGGKYSITEGWHSELSNKIRKSVLDGEYNYCDKNLCPSLNRLINTGKVDKFVFVPKEEFNEKDISVKTVLFGQDRSCNLKCPSCRKDVIRNYDHDHNTKLAIQEEVKKTFGRTIERISLTGSGDPLYSKIYKDFLINFNKKDFPKIKQIQIISNGNLLTKRLWNRFNCTEYIDIIDIGVDAGTKYTYENIVRLGGDWDKLMKNINFLASLTDRVRSFVFSYVVTQYNYKEIIILFNILSNIFKNSISNFYLNCRQIVYWNTGAYSEQDIENISIFKLDHPEHENFLIELRKLNKIPRTKKSCIDHNFHHLL